MSVWKQIAEYLKIEKKIPMLSFNQWMKYMHGINRLSILLFFIRPFVIVIKLLLNEED